MKIVRFFLLMMVFGGSTYFLYQKMSEDKRAQEIPHYGELKPFELQSHMNEPVNLENLKGQVTIASFVFSRCKGPCPLLCKEMAKLQKFFAKDPHIKQVSISMDPEHDTPEVLKKFANKHHALHHKWLFLTGKRQEVYNLTRHAFKLPMEKDPNLHTTKFVLLDKNSHIRGYYESFNPESLRKLKLDARALAKAPAA